MPRCVSAGATASRSSGRTAPGKTTLLEIVAGEQTPDEGTVTDGEGRRRRLPAAGGHRAGRPRPCSTRSSPSASHVTSLEHRLTVLEDIAAEETAGDEHERLLAEYGRLRERFEHLGGYTIESDARAVLTGLGFSETDMTRQTEEFSGGWLMRIALAKLLLAQPDVLLLDEPTNHLDLESVRVAGERSCEATTARSLLVSHDRAFMDGLVDRVVEIDNAQARGLPRRLLGVREAAGRGARAAGRGVRGAAAQDRGHREVHRALPLQGHEGQARCRAACTRSRRWSASSCRRDARRCTSSSRSRSARARRSSGSTGVSKALRRPRRVLATSTSSLYRGDKVALVGPNGAGKSTLLKMLAGVLRASRRASGRSGTR